MVEGVEEEGSPVNVDMVNAGGVVDGVRSILRYLRRIVLGDNRTEVVVGGCYRFGRCRCPAKPMMSFQFLQV